MNPLAGRRIVITRAADQADETAELVTAAGAVPVVVPLIEIVDEPRGMAELSDVELSSFDWIAVTSPNGSRRLAARLRADDSSPPIAAVGRATAAALPRCDLTADTQSAEGLLTAFPTGPGRVLVIQGVEAAPTLADGLAERDWDVVAIGPYRTVAVAPSATQRREALTADAVLFASGSAVRAWVAAFGTLTPPIVVAIGEQTSAAAQRVGLKISAISTDHSVQGMLATLSRYLSGAN